MFVKKNKYWCSNKVINKKVFGKKIKKKYLFLTITQSKIRRTCLKRFFGHLAFSFCRKLKKTLSQLQPATLHYFRKNVKLLRYHYIFDSFCFNWFYSTHHLRISKSVLYVSDWNIEHPALKRIELLNVINFRILNPNTTCTVCSNDCESDYYPIVLRQPKFQTHKLTMCREKGKDCKLLTYWYLIKIRSRFRFFFRYGIFKKIKLINLVGDWYSSQNPEIIEWFLKKPISKKSHLHLPVFFKLKWFGYYLHNKKERAKIKWKTARYNIRRYTHYGQTWKTLRPFREFWKKKKKKKIFKHFMFVPNPLNTLQYV